MKNERAPTREMIGLCVHQGTSFYLSSSSVCLVFVAPIQWRVLLKFPFKYEHTEQS